MKTLEQQLQSENRMCPQCFYILTDPFSEQCPRCNTHVPRLEVQCSKCIHHFGCPIALQLKKLS